MTLPILVVGSNGSILAVISRLIDAHPGWAATVATTVEEAETLFRDGDFSIVLVGAGFPARDEETLRERLTRLDPAVIVARHFGGGSGLLENEILGILLTKNRQHEK
jgi:hypothetical protein